MRVKEISSVSRECHSFIMHCHSSFHLAGSQNHRTVYKFPDLLCSHFLHPCSSSSPSTVTPLPPPLWEFSGSAAFRLLLLYTNMYYCASKPARFLFMFLISGPDLTFLTLRQTWQLRGSVPSSVGKNPGEDVWETLSKNILTNFRIIVSNW